MNLTVNNQILAQELRLMNKLVNEKAAIPVLANVLLEAKEDRLTLSATNLELALVSHCDAVVTAAGAVTLPAKKLLDLIEHTSSAEIRIRHDKHVYVSSGAFNSRLQSISADQFPTLPDSEERTSVSLNGAALKTLIEQTRYAIADKVQKYVLDGALLSIASDRLEMVATDSKRLA